MTVPRYAADNDGLRTAIEQNADRHQFLGAGAGAGKTTTLVSHYFHLLEQGFDPAQLVAVTFTEKAAAEMKQRLREQCRERARALRTDPAGGRWQDLLHEIEVAPISTIHGLCARLLRENALVAGLDPDFTVLDEVDAQILLDEVVRQSVLARLGQADTADTLVVAWGYARTVGILTGLVQDRAQIERLLADPAYGAPEALLARWAEQERELLAQELRRLLTDPQWQSACAHVLGPDPVPVPESDKLQQRRLAVRECLDRHDVARWSAQEASPATAEALVRVAEEMESLGTAGSAGTAKNWGDDQTVQAMRGALRVFLNRDGLLRDAAPRLRLLLTQSPEEQAAAGLTCALVAEVQAAVQAYALAKRARSGVDFEDLLQLTRDLWRDHPDALARTRRPLRHLMVDEFQDTNALQKEVLWPLVGDGGVQLFVVGDAKQSIYRFRNADVTVFNTTRQEMAAGGARDDELTRNFRSTDTLIGVFNRLFGDPALMGPPTDATPAWEATYEAMQVCRGAAPADQAPLEVHLTTSAKADAEEGGDEDAGEAVGMHELREQEARWLAGRLLHLLQSGEALVQHGRGPDAPWEAPRPGDMAILFRSLTDVQVYERALREAGLPYYLVVGRGFFTAQEVRDVVHLLRAIENGLDDIALVGALRSPLFGLSDETLYWLAQPSAGSWWQRVQQAVHADAPPETARITGEQRSRLAVTAALLRDFRAAKNRLPLGALVQTVLDRTGLTATLAGQFGGSQLVSNVRKLVELAGEFEAARQAQGQSSLRDFIEHLKRMTAEEVREGQAPVEEEAGDSIKLITIHSAKGLQWPIVVAPDLCRKPGGGFGGPYRLHRDLGLVAKVTRLTKADEGSDFWPPPAEAIKQRNEAEEQAENKRLFYVAATRAQDLLVLSGVTPLTKGGDVYSDAKKGPLGWINEALPAALWLPAGNEPAERLWRWDGETLVEQPHLATAAGPYQRAAPPAAAQAASEPADLQRRLDPVAPSATGQARFTATELSLYAHCPRLYELQLRRGLPGALPAFGSGGGASALSALELGTVIHQVLQLVGSGGRARLDELVPAGATMLRLNTLFDKRAADETSTIRERVQQFVSSPLYAELFQPGSYLRSEAGIACLLAVQGQDVAIEGKIDALIEDEAGQVHLLDYKTGEHDAAAEAQYRVQLGLYCHAVQQATGRPPASARLVYLSRRGLRVSALPVAPTAEEAVAQATAAIAGIWHGDFPRGSHDCEHCPGRALCHQAVEVATADEDD